MTNPEDDPGGDDPTERPDDFDWTEVDESRKNDRWRDDGSRDQHQGRDHGNPPPGHGSDDGTNQPPGNQRGPDQPPGNQRGPNQPPGNQRGPNQPPGNQRGPNQPPGNQRGPNQPPGSDPGNGPNTESNGGDNWGTAQGANSRDNWGTGKGPNSRDRRRPRRGPNAHPRGPETRRQYERDERGAERPPKGPRDDSQYNTDPVKAMFLGSVDLYDIATWEVRSGLDSFAVSLTNVLRRARVGALIAAGVVLFLAQIAVAGLLVLERPSLAVLTILSVLPAMGLAGYIWYGDPTTREPFALLGATFALSVLFASFAAIVNTVLQPAFGLLGIFGGVAFFFLVVGPIEELVKWLAIRVYAYKSDVFRTVLDGAVYGAIAGLGFASIENFIYIAQVYFQATPPGIDSQTQYAAIVASQRAFAGPGHVIFSSWAGFYLGLAKFNPENRGPIVVKGLLIAAFIHALYNTLVTILPLTVLTLFGFIIIYHGFWFGMLYRKISEYKELYQRLGYTGLPTQGPQ